MSHIATVKTKFRDLDCIEQAAHRLGGKLARGQKQHRWFGQWVGDTPMPAGVSEQDLGHCDHAISFPGAKYEVGVVDQHDGTFSLRWDYYGSGGLMKHMGNANGDRFTQAYNVVTATRAATRKGYLPIERLKPNGDIELDLLVR